jgi:hypothetical protein
MWNHVDTSARPVLRYSYCTKGRGLQLSSNVHHQLSTTHPFKLHWMGCTRLLECSEILQTVTYLPLFSVCPHGSAPKQAPYRAIVIGLHIPALLLFVLTLTPCHFSILFCFVISFLLYIFLISFWHLPSTQVSFVGAFFHYYSPCFWYPYSPSL